MKIQTPLKIGAVATAASGGTKLIVLPRKGARPMPGRVLRALAASVAHLSTIEALKLSIQARDEPWKALEAYASKTASADLQAVLDALAAAKLDHETKPDDAAASVAQSIDADPALVAEAVKLMAGQDKTIKAAIGWVASVDRAMLETAARAAASGGLALVPVKKSAKATKAGPKIEQQLQTILDKLTGLEAKLDDVDQRLVVVENK